MSELVAIFRAVRSFVSLMANTPERDEFLAWQEQGERLSAEGYNLKEVVEVTRIAAVRLKQIHSETDALAKATFSKYPRKED